MALKDDLVRLVQDNEVQRLSVLLGRFNPFEVLKIGHYELRHTNTLAWLLDPDANHGLGDTFLRAFIAQLGPFNGTEPLANRFETAADQSVTVRREVRLNQLHKEASAAERLDLVEDGEPMQDGAIDILIDGDGWGLAIEAKVRNGEGPGQLQNYLGALTNYAAEGKFVPVYLTINGDPPSVEGWMPANWQENVIGPLENALKIRQDLHPDIRFFLGSYLQTLKQHAGDGNDAETLAADLVRDERIAGPLRNLQEALGNNPLEKDVERLLRRHAPVIRLLLDQLVSPAALRAKKIETLLKEKGFCRLGGADSYISFVPTTWKETFPEMISIRGGSVVFEVSNRAPNMAIKLMVPSLGEKVQDALVAQRRELVRLIHTSQNTQVFPGAFYAVGGEEPQPRPATPRYYSVYRTAFQMVEGQAGDELTNWINNTLDFIKKPVLTVLEPLMKEAGLS